MSIVKKRTKTGRKKRKRRIGKLLKNVRIMIQLIPKKIGIL